MATSPPLPGDRPEQVYVSVKVMKVGTASLPDNWMYKDAQDAKVPDEVRTTIPCFSFLIEHPTRGKALFDLGMRKVRLLQAGCVN